MSRVGRPPRSQEQPDSPFGLLLKEHMRRVSNFTQVELSRETLIPERTLSQMIKGTRKATADTLRRDLRAIIKVLYRKQALASLEEANSLLLTIPKTAVLDHRDLEDAEVIELLAPDPLPSATSPDPSSGSATVSPSTLQPTSPVLPSRIKNASSPRQVRWMIMLVIASMGIIGGLGAGLFLFVHSLSTSTPPASSTPNKTSCANATNGVILYTDLYYQGQCHVFPPGSYELAQFGLAGNVSSLKDPNNAYHVTLYDTGKNLYHADTDIPAFAADWDNRADTMLVEKHRPTTCHPGTNGILAYIDTNYAGGCLFITTDILDLTPFDFDQIITSLRFVGSYRTTRQLVLYTRPNYQGECGAYWQDQPDLLQCARKALSVRVLPFTPPTPLSTVSGTSATGNTVVTYIFFSGSVLAAVDGYQPIE